MFQPSRNRRSISLSDLDLDADDLQHALRRGDAEARTCTALDPGLLPSWLMWARTVSGLRERLVPRGWTPTEQQNVPRTVHPSGAFSIVVNAGNGGTGEKALPVQTKYPRGITGIRAVRGNQLSLFGEAEPEEEGELTPTWILLVNRTGDAIRSELSLPTGINDMGTITQWEHRIVLPTIAVEHPSIDDNDEGPDFDVPVTRR